MTAASPQRRARRLGLADTTRQSLNEVHAHLSGHYIDITVSSMATIAKRSVSIKIDGLMISFTDHRSAHDFASVFTRAAQMFRATAFIQPARFTPSTEAAQRETVTQHVVVSITAHGPQRLDKLPVAWTAGALSLPAIKVFVGRVVLTCYGPKVFDEVAAAFIQAAGMAQLLFPADSDENEG